MVLSPCGISIRRYLSLFEQAIESRQGLTPWVRSLLGRGLWLPVVTKVGSIFFAYPFSLWLAAFMVGIAIVELTVQACMQISTTMTTLLFATKRGREFRGFVTGVAANFLKSHL
jgi:hypothetical protein